MLTWKTLEVDNNGNIMGIYGDLANKNGETMGYNGILV
jgi:hypothetical protein